MEVKAYIISGWDNALSAARFTAGKTTERGKMPSEEWRHKMALSEHSPLREVVYRVECFDVPRRAMTHLVRHHEGIEKYVETSRPDRNPNANTDTVNVAFTINAQALIQISRKRLCNKAWQETREVWQQILDAISKIDNVVPQYCVRECIYRFGICPETPSCGYCNTKDWKNNAIMYGKVRWHTSLEK